MFLAYIKDQWHEGNIKVGLSPSGDEGDATIIATGLPGLAATFLTKIEKHTLAELAKAAARAEVSPSTDIVRSTRVARLQPYAFAEISHARDILAESRAKQVDVRDVRRVWDRISVALDRHQDEDDPLIDLNAVEKELAEVGQYR